METPYLSVRPGAMVALVMVALACSQGRDAGSDRNPYDLRGHVLPAPLDKPDVILTDTRGESFDLRQRTDGFLTLLFFGYTYCPDICPIHMANLSAVMRELPPSVTQRIKVVFVTTDPDRDTPERLSAWLAHFDPTFIGLTGDTAAVNAAQRALYLPLPQLAVADSTGRYEVGHAAAIVAFAPDNRARVLYPFGIRQADWAHDLPKLLEIRWHD